MIRFAPLAAAAIMAATAPATASNGELCANLANTGRGFMEARQNGIPRYVLENMLMEKFGDDPVAFSIGTVFISTAYNTPQMATHEDRTLATDIFVGAFLSQCLNGG